MERFAIHIDSKEEMQALAQRNFIEQEERSRKRLFQDNKVEVVLCKDCRYNDGKGSIADGRYWCNRHQAFMHYCSDAERRDDG